MTKCPYCKSEVIDKFTPTVNRRMCVECEYATNSWKQKQGSEKITVINEIAPKGSKVLIDSEGVVEASGFYTEKEVEEISEKTDTEYVIYNNEKTVIEMDLNNPNKIKDIDSFDLRSTKKLIQ